MAYKLEILESARRDEEDIVRYLARDAGSPAAALKFMDELDARAHSIQLSPFSRPLCLDASLAEAGYRSFAIMSYVVLYLVKEDKHSALEFVDLNQMNGMSDLRYDFVFEVEIVFE